MNHIHSQSDIRDKHPSHSMSNILSSIQLQSYGPSKSTLQGKTYRMMILLEHRNLQGIGQEHRSLSYHTCTLLDSRYMRLRSLESTTLGHILLIQHLQSCHSSTPQGSFYKQSTQIDLRNILQDKEQVVLKVKGMRCLLDKEYRLWLLRLSRFPPGRW